MLAGNSLDVSAYQCVGVAARNRQNKPRPSSLLRPTVTRWLPTTLLFRALLDGIGVSDQISLQMSALGPHSRVM